MSSLQQAPTVILGGGIIGLSTTYHLARPSPNTPIVVADPSTKVCGGASGKCEGALGEFGLAPEIEPLGKLSYRLYSELAPGAKVGYSSLVIHTVFPVVYDPADPLLLYPVKEPEALENLPSWIKTQESWKGGLINDGSTAARVDPRKFCAFLQKECEKKGVEFLTHTTAVGVAWDKEGPSGIQLRENGNLRPVPCKNLVISAGSWLPEQFFLLFPWVDIGLCLAEKQHVQTWLRFSAKDKDTTGRETTKAGSKTCDQVWLNPLGKDNDVHVSSFADGELYAAGALEQVPAENLPPPDKVRPTPEEVSKLRDLVARYVHHEGRIRAGES